MNDSSLRRKTLRKWVAIIVGMPILAVLMNLLGFYYVSSVTHDRVLTGEDHNGVVREKIKNE